MDDVSPRQRLLVLALAVIAAGAAVWAMLRFRETGSTSVVVNNTRELRALLDRRAGEPWPDDVPRPEPSADPPPLLREPMGEETASVFFPRPQQVGDVFHTALFYRMVANQDRPWPFDEYPGGVIELRTNHLGMREDEDVRADEPDLRILVVGDSQTAGVVPNRESYTNVLEARLAAARPDRGVEALNAAVGGSNPYSYLGMLEVYAELEPDLVLVAVFGGNDFSPMMPLQRYFHRRPAHAVRPYTEKRLDDARKETGSAVPHEMGQVVYFLNNPEDVVVCKDTLAALSLEMERVCRESGARLGCLYIPTAFTAQARFVEDQLDHALERLGLDADQLRLSDEIADAWIAFLAERGIPCLDLRPAFRAAEELWFWRSDLHLNTVGHREIAERLEPFVEEVLRDGE